MLVNVTKVINVSAVSALPTGSETADAIMYFGAAINRTNEVNFSKNITNIKLYKSNAEMCEKDYTEFQNMVLGMIETDE